MGRFRRDAFLEKLAVDGAHPDREDPGQHVDPGAAGDAGFELAKLRPWDPAAGTELAQDEHCLVADCSDASRRW